MRAVVLDQPGGPERLVPRDVPDPAPVEHEVLVRVRAAGVCGRDLIDRAGGFPMMKRPTILGHELAGEVEALGPGVTEVAVGDRVVNLHRPFCGTCSSCLAGEAVDCERAWQSFGHTVDGAYAQRVVCHERALVPLPADIDFVPAASVGCTAGVALRALRHEAELQLGETVLITGASGGVGMAAIQVAKAMGARVIAVTSSAAKEARLRDVGADHVVVSADGAFHDAVRAVTDGGHGADVALELTGEPTFASALRSLRRRGRLVLLGNITMERLRVNPGAVILWAHRIRGSHGFTARDLADCFDLMRSGRLEIVVDRTLPLDQAADAHRLLADRAVVGRVVLVPSDVPPSP